MSCHQLTKCITTAACTQTAGLGITIYVGLTDDINTSTTTFDADGSISAFALNTGKNLRKFTAQKFKHTARHELTKGENGQTFYNHFVESKFNIENQADIAALEELAKAENLFVIVKLNMGKFKVFGLNPNDIPGFGLSSSEGGQSEGLNMGDDNMDRLVLSGLLPNKPMFYKPTASLAANTTEIEGFVSCP